MKDQFLRTILDRACCLKVLRTVRIEHPPALDEGHEHLPRVSLSILNTCICK